MVDTSGIYVRDGITLVDFEKTAVYDESISWSSGCFSKNTDSAYVYKDKTASGALSFSRRGNMTIDLSSLGAESDWSKYTAFGMHLYANEPGSKIGFLLNVANDGNSCNGGYAYYYYNYTVEQAGWQYIEIPFDDFVAQFDGGNTESFELIQSVTVSIGGWKITNSYLKTTQVYFDEWYLNGDAEASAPPVFLDCANEADRIADFKLPAETEITYNNAPYSLKVDLSDKTNNNQWINTATLQAHGKPLNLAGYDYLKLRVYVPQNLLGQGYGVRMLINHRINSSSYTAYEPKILFNWNWADTENGWYTVKLDIASMQKKDENMSPEKEILHIWLNAGYYGHDTVSPAGSYMYLDKVWMENEEEITPFNLKASNYYKKSNKVVFSFSNYLKGIDENSVTIEKALDGQKLETFMLINDRENNRLTVDLGNSTEYGCEYILKTNELTDKFGQIIEPVTFKFTTESRVLTVGEIVYEKSSDAVTVKSDVKNTLAETKNLVMVSELYDDKGDKLNSATSECTLLEGQSETLFVDMPVEGSILKAYIYDAENTSVILKSLTVPLNYVSDESILLVKQFSDSNGVDGDLPFEISEETYSGSGSLKLDISEAEQSVNYEAGIEVQKYNYLYAWVYSPPVSSSTLNFKLYGEELLNMGVYCVPANFTGWKLVEIPFDSLAAVSDNFDKKYLQQISININSDYKNSVEWTENANVYIDSFYLSEDKLDTFEIIGTNPSLSGKISKIASEILIGFSGYCGPVTADMVKLSDGQNEILCLVGQNGSNLTVKPADNLVSDACYTLELSGNIKDSIGQPLSGERILNINIKGDELHSGKPVITSLSGFSAEAEVVNESGSAKEVTLVLNVYDLNGKLVEASSTTKTFADGESNTVSCSAENGKSAQAFVYDSSFKLVSDVVSKMPDSGYEVYEESDFSGQITLNAERDGIWLNVSGVAKGGTTALIVIKAPDGSVVNVFAEEISADGSYQAKLPFDVVSEIYTVTAYCEGVKSEDVKIAMMSETDWESLRIAVNGSPSYQDTKNLVNGKKDFMELTNASDCSLIFWEQKPFNSVDELKKAIEDAGNLISSLNNTSWDSMSKFFSDNSVVLFGNIPAYTTYKGFTEKVQNNINVLIKQNAPYKDFESFRLKFTELVNQNIGGIPVLPGIGGLTGGGGGGRGGSSARVSSSASYDIYTEEIKNQAVSFKDLSGCEWAEEYIYNLLDENILTMSADNNYRPFDNITREEFVKLLVEAFDIEKAEAEFTDVNSSHWFNTYVGGAQKSGIVLGDENGAFGAGKNITRQDMVTMALRALKVTGKTLNENGVAVSFDDKNEISDYALEAVEKMTAGNVISGMGNNKFAPMENANRAQAAVMISRLLTGLKGGV